MSVAAFNLPFQAFPVLRVPHRPGSAGRSHGQWPPRPPLKFHAYAGSTAAVEAFARLFSHVFRTESGRTCDESLRRPAAVFCRRSSSPWALPDRSPACTHRRAGRSAIRRDRKPETCRRRICSLAALGALARDLQGNVPPLVARSSDEPGSFHFANHGHRQPPPFPGKIGKASMSGACTWDCLIEQAGRQAGPQTKLGCEVVRDPGLPGVHTGIATVLGALQRLSSTRPTRSIDPVRASLLEASRPHGTRHASTAPRQLVSGMNARESGSANRTSGSWAVSAIRQCRPQRRSAVPGLYLLAQRLGRPKTDRHAVPHESVNAFSGRRILTPTRPANWVIRSPSFAPCRQIGPRRASPGGKTLHYQFPSHNQLPDSFRGGHPGDASTTFSYWPFS